MQRAEVQLLANNRWSEVSESLPSRIEGTFDLPKVSELVQATGLDSVAAFIEFELVKLSALVSVGGNLSKSQVPFIASQLIDLYPNETIADFKICFQRGARGDYGDIFRLDGLVIRKWMELYLEEKYQFLEDKLMKEKDHPHVPIGPEKIAYAPIKDGLPAPPEVAQKYIDELMEKLKPDGKKIPPLTDDEIRREGQERPKASEYQMPSAEWLEQRKKERYEFQEKTVRERHPEWTEEQVQARLKELRKNDV